MQSRLLQQCASDSSSELSDVCIQSGGHEDSSSSEKSAFSRTTTVSYAAHIAETRETIREEKRENSGVRKLDRWGYAFCKSFIIQELSC